MTPAAAVAPATAEAPVAAATPVTAAICDALASKATVATEPASAAKATLATNRPITARGAKASVAPITVTMVSGGLLVAPHEADANQCEEDSEANRQDRFNGWLLFINSAADIPTELPRGAWEQRIQRKRA